MVVSLCLSGLVHVCGFRGDFLSTGSDSGVSVIPCALHFCDEEERWWMSGEAAVLDLLQVCVDRCGLEDWWTGGLHRV